MKLKGNSGGRREKISNCKFSMIRFGKKIGIEWRIPSQIGGLSSNLGWMKWDENIIHLLII